MLGVRASCRRRKLGIALELVAGVLVDRLEHRESLTLPVLGRTKQALVDERAEPVDDVHAGQRVDADAHRFDIFDLRRREHREHLEQGAFVLVEELVAPGDRRAQRPLAFGQVARTPAQDIEPAPQAVEQLGGREQTKPRGRELDREWQSVEPRTDLADDGGRLVVETEVRPCLSPALQEEGDGRRVHRPGGARRQREGRHRQELLPADPQRLAARHEEREPGAMPDKVRGVVGGRHHLFEVVQDQEEPPRPEVRGERLAQVVIARDRKARRLGDRDEDRDRFARVREIDEEDAVGVMLEGIRRRLDGQPRLADPAWPGQCHEPCRVAAEQTCKLLELRRPPYQRRRGDR